MLQIGDGRSPQPRDSPSLISRLLKRQWQYSCLLLRMIYLATLTNEAKMRKSERSVLFHKCSNRWCLFKQSSSHETPLAHSVSMKLILNILKARRPMLPASPIPSRTAQLENLAGIFFLNDTYQLSALQTTTTATTTFHPLTLYQRTNSPQKKICEEI